MDVELEAVAVFTSVEICRRTVLGRGDANARRPALDQHPLDKSTYSIDLPCRTAALWTFMAACVALLLPSD